ncbi:actin-associated protein FAM107A-like [Pelmatolapia mariae]|uniref:actin-associated protein FAM107A-like n=1 Tax=Pelmatolapia mariae TaxID=158779 RepID=UPI002FE672D2
MGVDTIEQVNDGVLNSEAGLVSKLKGILMWPDNKLELVKDDSFQGLHDRGLALSSRSELQQVLERRKREQSYQDEEQHSRTPLEKVLLRRQQKQHEREKKQDEEVREESQLMEFVRVRQNLRKIHTVVQDKNANS